ncbi:hypothetical protein C8J56DRAFT_1061081 [Mycena floridula]|nr:hypothetical protein C8J56DRAFT_1061081 [Mycena floridula]
MSTPLSDPSAEVCPDFNSPAFEDDWTKAHVERVAAFIAWKANEPRSSDGHGTGSTKKTPKVNDNLVVPTVQDSRPSSYALKKLEEYAHVDL